MSDYKVTDTELISVANAIRTKGGTQAQLEWPSGFVSAIGDISGGGSTPASDDPFALTDYIQSSGTQYIDTGYIPNENTRLELVAEFLTNNSYSCIFGCGNQSNQGWFIYERSPSQGYVDLHGNTYNVVADTFAVYANKIVKLSKAMTGSKMETAGFVCNGFSYSDSEYTLSYNLILFGKNVAGTVSGLSKLKLYRCRIYESDALVHEFIPWVDDNDVVCLKDTVTGNLKYNAGTGTFTYGTDSE